MSELADVEHRHLRSAIEYAVAMGEEVQKRKLAVTVPSELRPMYGKPRVPSAALGRLRRAIERNDAFRDLIAVGALPELVDEVGRLWLQRPDGWDQQVRSLVAAAEEEQSDADVRAALTREAKRRRAAEQAAARVQAELAEARTIADGRSAELDALRADLAKADDEIAALRLELIDVRNDARHARDREAAALARLERVDAERAEVPPSSSSPEVPPVVDVEHLAEVAASARSLADRLHRLLPERDPAVDPIRTRVPLQLPGGVMASSAAAARSLVRSEASFLIDGYNVAKLGWPSLPLEQQRTALLDAVENVARRFGTDLTVVFDGASVVGAHADRRRTVRVVFSSHGVTADDVIRDEVDRLPVDRGVVVVTNDAEIVRDVKAAGANVLPSNAFIAVF